MYNLNFRYEKETFSTEVTKRKETSLKTFNRAESKSKNKPKLKKKKNKKCHEEEDTNSQFF